MSKVKKTVAVPADEFVLVANSSTIHSYKWHGTEKARYADLSIKFKNGGVYTYMDVDLATFNEFVTADSRGSYFSANIRGVFLTEKVESAPEKKSNKLHTLNVMAAWPFPNHKKP